MNILGIHGGITINQHDAGAALIVDGELISFIEEERLLRVKTPRGVLPIESISRCLKDANLTMKEIDYVALAGATYIDQESRTKLYLEHHFGSAPPVVLVNHQLAHVASAFFPSGFDDAMCMSYDAYGDKLSLAMGVGSKDGVEIIETRPHENSLGMFYATITSFLGFMPGEDEYKVMGLAPYGNEGVDLSAFIQVASDGYQVNQDFIRSNPTPGSTYEQFYSQKLIDLLGKPRRKGEKITQRHMDIAAAAQKSLENCALSLVKYLHKVTGLKRLCLAGGVALNCSVNGVLSKLPFIEEIFIQPSASDRGLPLGCALYIAHQKGEKLKPITHVFYGPKYDSEEVEKAIKLAGFEADKIDDPGKIAAQLLVQGKIIGWHQGRSEFGPRALGHRSILAHPGLNNMKNEINLRVKFREEFRPFAPSVLEEFASKIFFLKHPSRFMTQACDVRPEWIERLPATTHVNNTGRVQTVDKTTNPVFYNLIRHFYDLTGLPVVLNTSFNIKGQPIVETPLEALSTFAGTGIDALIMGDYLITKPKKPRTSNFL